MSDLGRTTAIAAVLSCFALAANAQDNAQTGQTASNTQTGGMQANYCDQPWSKVDGNSDGVISKQEASAAIENQFGQIDTNGNGEITKTEWVDCMGSMNEQAAAEASRDTQNFAEAEEEHRTARQQMLDDQLTTGSTKSQDGASAQDTASTSGETASGSGDGIPVYIYRFWTM